MTDSTGSAPKVAVVATGEMGQGVGRRLRENGAVVTTSVAGRSARTVRLAEAAGIVAVPDDDQLVRGCDVLLSIVPPGQAVANAERFAAAMGRTGARPVFVECNAVSAETTRRIADIVGQVAGAVVDVGIIGPPPGKDRATKFYASGPQGTAFDRLKACGLDIRWIGGALGDASTLKMCYGGLTKGLQALVTSLMVQAERAGVGDALIAELSDSQVPLLGWVDRNVTRMPPKAYRWVAEMEEGAASIARAGLPPQMLEGAARIYDWIAATSLGKETPENRQRGTDRASMMKILAEELAAAAAPAPRKAG